MKVLKLLSASSILLILICCSSGENKDARNYESGDQSENAPSLAKEGEALYLKYCMACHQTNGSGVPGMYPPLIKSPTVNSGNKEDFIRILLNGLRGPIEVHGKKYNQQMPSQNFLSDEELAQIINYVSTSFENNGTKVTPGDVKALRNN